MDVLREKETWEYAKAVNVVSLYEGYLRDYPNGVYAYEAQARLAVALSARDWNEAERKNTIAAYQAYIRDHPTSERSGMARSRIDDMKKDQAWQRAESDNTDVAYESYIRMYPDCPRRGIAESRIRQIQAQRKIAEERAREEQIQRALEEEKSARTAEEEGLWEYAQENQSIEAYERYLKAYPMGEHASEARQVIDGLRRSSKAWNKCRRLNTVQAYRQFLDAYGDSPYAVQAIERLEAIEDDLWTKASEGGSLAALRRYIRDFPSGRYMGLTEDLLIELEVRSIASGRHSVLPPMDRTGGYSSSYESHVSVTNQTAYTLTILYSGAEKKRIEIAPHGTSTHTLRNGMYTIAARVSNPSVIPFSGRQDYSSGRYSASYYITTRRY